MLRALMVLLALVCFCCVGCKKESPKVEVPTTTAVEKQAEEAKDVVKDAAADVKVEVENAVKDVNEKI